jgi:hypothetical protein
MKRLDADGELRARLSAAGPLQAARFSQDAYRHRLEQLYAASLRPRQVIGQRRRGLGESTGSPDLDLVF